MDNRFHYPQSNKLPRTTDSAIPSQASSQFPPHPSVRVPANVKTAGRQIPPGVGISPRPGKPVTASRPQAQPAARPQNTGQMIQNFKFPQVPPPIPAAVRPQKSREFDSRSKYNMHNSYVSSNYEDSPQSRNTPSSKSPGRGQPLQFRDSASVYPETEANDSPQAAYPSSRAIPQQEFPPSPLRNPSSGYPSSKTTPHINTTDLDPPKKPRPGEISPASSRTTAMNALSAAIAAGFSSNPKVESPRTPPSRTFSPMRMPFEQGSRPRSVDEQSQEEDIAPPELIDPPSSKTPMLSPSSARSAQSTNPLLGLGISKPGMSSKVPVTKRPPKLDIDAVRDMEARGSTTSLTDLIKRATRLAANLDRGKTASRLGMLDAFGSKEKLGHFAPGNRDSTMSDMLSSFPVPTLGGTPRRETMWPLGEKGDFSEDEGRGKNMKRKRRCCGMSLSVAIVVLVVLVILIAAAVLIPIFLILVPKQHQSTGPDLSQCAQTNPCYNGGTSIVTNNDCACVCSNGFTGLHCGLKGGTADCTTASVRDGSNTYKNATMGDSIMPLFSEARSRFDVPLNASVILSIFSTEELACVNENTLVSFNATSTSATSKRFVIVPDLEPDLAYNPHLMPMPTRTTTAITTPTPNLDRRQDYTVGTTNGIVFQTTSGVEPTNSAAPTVTSVAEGAATSSAAAPTASTMTDTSAIEKQLNFAQVVVLYALQQSSTVNFAVNAQQSMNLFFSSVTSNSTVEVGTDALPLTVDFKSFTIITGDGKVIGDKAN